jgi:hypothetical protein
MKIYGGVDVQIHVLLTSALVGKELLSSRSDRFTLEERDHGTNLAPEPVWTTWRSENS